MADLPTRDELFARARAAALAVPNTKISAREIDREGSDANLLFAAMTLMGETIVNRMALALSGCFEATAANTDDERLDRIIWDRKQLPRKPAAPAVGTIQISRPTAAAGAGTIQGNLPGASPQPTRIRTNQGIVYWITESANFGPLALGPITVPIQAELAGVASEVDVGQAWSFVDPVFDDTLTIANADETAGAADAETNSEYLARSRDFFRTVRRGTLAAIEFGLRSTPGIASTAVLEEITPLGLPAYVVRGYLLDALGRANQTLAARGQLSLLEYRALGVPTLLTAGSPLFVPMRMRIGFDTTIILDTGRGAQDVRSAIVAALQNQISGAPLYRTTTIAAVRSVPGIIFEDNDLFEPVGTLYPATPDVTYRTLPELIEFV